MVLEYFSAPDERVNFYFYFCNSGTGPGDRDTYYQEPLHICKADYVILLLSYLELEFPESDICRGRDNRILIGAWNIAVQKIEVDMSHAHFDDTVFDLHGRFTGWAVNALDREDMIVTEGNQ